MTLTTSQLDHYRSVLENERTRLTEAVENLHTEVGYTNETEENGLETHMGDQGTDTFRREMEQTLEGHEQGILREVDAALERIKDGTYGKCEDCGNSIPAERLEALPYTSRCVDCAAKR